jgi:MinD superfamily P-loop ATPase
MTKIAIASGKGGTGKTTVAVNLAVLLSETRRTALIDLDVEEPNSNLFLQGSLTGTTHIHRYVPSLIENRCTSCGLCQEVCNFHAVLMIGEKPMVFPQLCHGCFACSELCPAGALPMIPEPMGVINGSRREALDILEGCLDVGQEQAVPLIKETKKAALDQFGTYEALLFDSPPGTSCPFVEAVSGSDYVLLVTEPTPFGLHDLKLAVETVRDMGLRFAVIINRDGIGDDRVQRWCDAQDIDVIAVIPDSRAAAESYSRGELIYQSDIKLEESFRQLIGELEQRGMGGVAR